MKLRLMILANSPRGSACPTTVRAVRCPVKSGNERDPRPQLPAGPLGTPGTLWRLPGAKPEEGVGNGRSVCSDRSGLHAGCNGWYNGMQLRKKELISKTSLSQDCGLQLIRMNMESLVIVFHYGTVNTSPRLVHTARRCNQLCYG